VARKKKSSGKHPKPERSRSLSTLYRTSGKKLPRKRLIVVCEGAETEPRYFQAIRQRHRLPTLSIQIVKGKGDPKNVVKEAVKQKDALEDKRDEVWCVFDTEIRTNNPTFDEAVQKSRAMNLRLAVSNPAFEYWYVLHFESTDRPFQDAGAVLNALLQHIPDYDKSSDVFHELEAKTAIAVENARQLRQRACEPWDDFPNPSTSVDKLVCSILELVA